MNEVAKGPGGFQEPAHAGEGPRDLWRLLPLYCYVVVEFGKPESLAPIRPGLLLQAGFLVLIVARSHRVLQILRQTHFALLTSLIALMAVHVFIASNNFMAFMVWRQMLSYLIFGLGYCLLLDTVQRVVSFLVGFVLIMAAISAITLFGLGGVVGGIMLMGDTNDWALATNAMIPVALFLGLSRRGLARIACLASVGVFLSTAVASLSRGGFVGMAVVAAICLSQLRHRLRSALVFAVVGAVLFGTMSDAYKREIQTIWEEGTDTSTGRDRIELWKVGLKMFREHMVLGVGQGNLSLRMGEFQYDDNGSSHWGRNISGRTVHSVFVQILSELGLVGGFIIGFLAINARNLAQSVIRDHRQASVPDAAHCSGSYSGMLGLKIGIYGYLATAAFLSALYYPYLWNFTSLITVLNLARDETSDRNGSRWSRCDGPKPRGVQGNCPTGTRAGDSCDGVR